jgi:hypothetical protein
VAAALALSVWLALLGPAGTAAKGARGKTVVSPGFSLKGAGGYELQVGGTGGRVYATIEKKSRAFKTSGNSFSFGDLSNTYFVRGIATRSRLEADFGPFGKVDLEFTPSGKTRQPRRAQICGGQQPVEQPGHFSGTVSFTGDHGFATFHAKRVKGRIFELSEVSCGRRVLSSRGAIIVSSGGKPEALLDASAPDGDVSFAAVANAAPERPDFFATEGRRYGRLLELRSAESIGDEAPGAFELDEGLTAATVRPSAPFEGEASFRRETSGETTWSGTLAVPFLGGGVQLTGGAIEASLGRPKTQRDGSR